MKSSSWDIIAWNEAAAAVLIDYEAVPAGERNVLRILFCKKHLRTTLPNCEHVARFVVASFRTEITRTGTCQRAQGLVEELSRMSPEFAAMWLDHDVSTYGEGTKLVQPAHGGPVEFEYSSFVVDGQPGLGMVVYTPRDPCGRGAGPGVDRAPPEDSPLGVSLWPGRASGRGCPRRCARAVRR